MTSEGEEYVGMFRKLRLPQLINHSMDMEMLITGKKEYIFLRCVLLKKQV